MNEYTFVARKQIELQPDEVATVFARHLHEPVGSQDVCPLRFALLEMGHGWTAWVDDEAEDSWTHHFIDLADMAMSLPEGSARMWDWSGITGIDALGILDEAVQR